MHDIVLAVAQFTAAHVTSFFMTAALLVFTGAWAATSYQGKLTDSGIAVILAMSGFLGALTAHLVWTP